VRAWPPFAILAFLMLTVMVSNIGCSAGGGKGEVEMVSVTNSYRVPGFDSVAIPVLLRKGDLLEVSVIEVSADGSAAAIRIRVETPGGEAILPFQTVTTGDFSVRAKDDGVFTILLKNDAPIRKVVTLVLRHPGRF